MDFVEGKSLAALLAERGGPLGEAEARPWIRQVCDALEYLHSRTPPIIHRDIKPDNIIIGPDGRAMLVDFGISKVYDPRQGHDHRREGRHARLQPAGAVRPRPAPTPAATSTPWGRRSTTC
jgi:serine/threonine protein kinase